MHAHCCPPALKDIVCLFVCWFGGGDGGVAEGLHRCVHMDVSLSKCQIVYTLDKVTLPLSLLPLLQLADMTMS